MKKLTHRLGLCALLVSAALLFSAMTCSTNTQSAAYRSIGTTEALVSATYSGFMTSVALGQTPTNAVPEVSAAFNATQMTLHTAAVMASLGTNAPPPAAAVVQAQSFQNLVASKKGAVK